jgi:hypothetical protein
MALAACSSGSLRAQADTSADAAAVYRMAFDFLFFNNLFSGMGEEPQRPELFVIRDTTAELLTRFGSQDVEVTRVPSLLRFMFPAARPDLAERFVRGITVRMHPELPELRVPVTFLSAAQADSLFQNVEPTLHGWDRFRARYPGAVGLTEVSPVVFDADATQALVYIGTQSDYFEGAGYVLLFERQDGTWRLLAHQQVWVS